MRAGLQATLDQEDDNHNFDHKYEVYVWIYRTPTILMNFAIRASCLQNSRTHDGMGDMVA